MNKIVEIIISSNTKEHFITNLEQFDNKEYQTICYNKLLEEAKRKFCINVLDIKQQSIVGLKTAFKNFGVDLISLVGRGVYTNILFNNIPDGYTIIKFYANIKNRVRLILDEMYKMKKEVIDKEFYEYRTFTENIYDTIKNAHIDNYYESGIYVKLLCSWLNIDDKINISGFRYFHDAIKPILPVGYKYIHKSNIYEYALVKGFSDKKIVKVFRVITTDMFTFLRDAFTPVVCKRYIDLLSKYIPNISYNYNFNLNELYQIGCINFEQMLMWNLGKDYFIKLIKLVYPHIDNYIMATTNYDLFFYDLNNTIKQQKSACEKIKSEWLSNYNCFKNVCNPIYQSLSNLDGKSGHIIFLLED